jgi:hypothetical protein
MQDIIDELQTLVRNTEISRDILYKCRVALDKADKVIKDASENLIKLNSASYINSFVRNLDSLLEDGAQDILISNVMRAIETSEEFKKDILASRLLAAAKSPGIIDLIFRGSGWERSVVVNQRWDEIAGSLSDWAAAVDAVREENDWGPYAEKAQPQRASNFWRNIIYGREDYLSTMEQRIDAADVGGGGIAPFWELLDKGNSIGMASDWGGKPYPKNMPTNFVDDTATEIQRNYRQILSESKVAHSEDVANISASINEIKNLSDDITNKIRELEQVIDTEDLLKKVADRLERDVSELSLDKLLKFMRDFESGYYAYERVELSASYLDRVRPTVGRLSSILYSGE